MPYRLVAERADSIERLIPRPPADVSLLRASFVAMVASQWQRHVPPSLGDASLGSSQEQAVKVRFMAEMYARAGYSMLLVSARGPLVLRSVIRVAAHLRLSRDTAIRCGCYLLSFLEQLVPRSVHRQLALMATLMGIMDIALDEAAPEGRDFALRVASMLSPQPRTTTRPLESSMKMVTKSIRSRESRWQAGYWNKVLLPATREYCAEEALAVANVPDATGLGHRWAGIEAAVKGMWYVVGPCIGLDKGPDDFQRPHWNRQQRWMADTSLLMQMIDDWVDQDEDQSIRSTPVIAGEWRPETIQRLYTRTMADLAALLEESRIHNQVFQDLFSDLYTDYLYAAVEAMRSGLAA